MDNDALFRREWEEGLKWQKAVANALRAQGLPVVERSTEFLNGVKLTDTQINLEDLECSEELLEVKSRNYKFTGPSDFPFEESMIDTVRSWDGKKRKPYAYIHVSRPTRRGMWISGTDNSAWTTVRCFDRIRGIEEVSYAAPRSLWRPMHELVYLLKVKTLTPF
jgi:hypothetical protein